MRTRDWLVLGTVVGSMLVGACGDDDNAGDDIDASTPTIDAEPDEIDAADPVEIDAATPTIDAGPEPEAVPHVLALSPTGTDAFFGVTYDKDGNLYAAGHISDGVAPTSDRSFVVAKILPSGELDTTFGEGGFSVKNVVVGGAGETARPVVVQSTGKIIVGGVIEHDPTATGLLLNDRDIALVRFNTDGSVDTTFGTDGVKILDLNAGLVTTEAMPRLVGADAVWSLSVYADDRILLHGSQRAVGFLADGTTPRPDNDWAAIRLTADGELDDTFATGGKFLLDIEGANGSARSAMVLPDGSVVGGGYTNAPSMGTTQAVLYKLTPAGVLDTTFGNGGVFHQIVLSAATEAYGAALQNGKLVTAGYGRNNSGESLDFVSLRLTSSGDLDASWGSNGVVRIDVAGFADNGRSVVVLPDFRVLLIGGGEAAAGQKDAMLALLGPNGATDSTLGPFGWKLWDLGGSGDFFWAGSVSPDGKHVALAGLKGAGNAPTDTNNDDAAVFIMPLGQ